MSIRNTDASGHVRCWHFSSGTCLYVINEHREQTLALAFNYLGERFATVGSDPQVVVYDVETKKRLSVLVATSVFNPLSRLKFKAA